MTTTSSASVAFLDQIRALVAVHRANPRWTSQTIPINVEAIEMLVQLADTQVTTASAVWVLEAEKHGARGVEKSLVQVFRVLDHRKAFSLLAKIGKDWFDRDIGSYAADRDLIRTAIQLNQSVNNGKVVCRAAEMV